MHDAVPSVISAWSNFYVITGSSAAALTGLMFIVVTLITDEHRRSTDVGISTFSTPVVVHFGVALLVSAVLSAPWPWLAYAATLLGLTGLYGIAYVSRVMAGMRDLTKRTATYTPERDDWVWYVALPMVAYVVILAGALLLPSVSSGALYALAAATILLLFIGIRNAWDIVTFLAVEGAGAPKSPS
jgi:hypothetical protein